MTFVKTSFARFSWLFALGMLLFAACEEIPPKLNLRETGEGPTTSALADQPKGVLIEEFTGVRCVNCPAGAEAIAQAKQQIGKQLVPISVHAGFFARPYAENTFDFRTSTGDAIQTLLGEPQGYPSAVIDRKKFDGEQALQLARNSWDGYTGIQLALEPAVAIGLTPTYDSTSRELTVEVELLGRTGTDGRGTNLSVFLLENEVEDYQLTPEGKQSDYLHEHALRETFTAATGNPIGAIAPEQSETFEYTLTVDSEYDANHLEIVAFVHYADIEDDGKEVLQAVSVGVE